jgi:hypothetical protein
MLRAGSDRPPHVGQTAETAGRTGPPRRVDCQKKGSYPGPPTPAAQDPTHLLRLRLTTRHHVANRGSVPLPAARRIDSHARSGHRRSAPSDVTRCVESPNDRQRHTPLSHVQYHGFLARDLKREGSASSSPTILKLCSRPSFLRRVTVVPKDAWPRAGSGLTTSALVRRARQ